MNISCRVCGNREGNVPHRFQEMMFGSGEEFDYCECGACGCLQIACFPEDMERYYGPNYYSMGAPPRLFDSPFTRRLKKLRLKAAISEGSLLARVFLMIYPPHKYMTWMKRANVTSSSKILDVGCGAGDLLVRMQKDGFLSLMGIDPHLDHDRVYENGVTVLKKGLFDLEGAFDCIMLHHSFEHMGQPHETMARLCHLLLPGGCLLIRIPVAGTFAWREYGRNWVQIDAPRHLFLHTEQSMEILAQRAGLTLGEVVFDSDEFQFWGSEQARQGIFLQSEQSHAVDAKRSQFSSKQMKAYKKKAQELNRTGDGDQACFFLFKG